MLFEQESKKGSTQHEGETVRTIDIKVNDTELLIETFRLFNEAVANGTFSYLNVIIDEHYDLQKFEIVTKTQE